MAGLAGCKELKERDAYALLRDADWLRLVVVRKTVCLSSLFAAGK